MKEEGLEGFSDDEQALLSSTHAQQSARVKEVVHPIVEEIERVLCVGGAPSDMFITEGEAGADAMIRVILNDPSLKARVFRSLGLEG